MSGYFPQNTAFENQTEICQMSEKSTLAAVIWRSETWVYFAAPCR